MLHALVLAVVLKRKVILRHGNGAEEPVGGALVEILDRGEPLLTAMTATDGSFSFPAVAPDIYSLGITSNYGGSSGDIMVPLKVPVETRTFYVFDPTCGAIYGRVRDQVSGLPVPGAQVDYMNSRVLTDANGDYFISFGCFSGSGFRFHNSFDYGVHADGYAPIERFGGRAEYVSGNGGTILDFDLRPLHQAAEEPPRQHERRP